MTQPQYTGYQARSFWYTKFFGVPVEIHKNVMEDGKTKLGIMEYAPIQNELLVRSHWTYATNGMSERRMPCQEEPCGDPRIRIELVVYSGARAPWIIQLLSVMARYPFVHRSGFATNQTMPVTDPNPQLWDGYLLATPPCEPEEFNPLAVDIGIGDDWVFHLQVVGLKSPELMFAIENGGQAFAESYLALHDSEDEMNELLYLDRYRESLM
jgi:hypothetical protein